jgi:hypothetical protein
LRIIGNFLTIIGILVVFSSTVLPIVKLPQTLVKTGPSVNLTESNNYWIDTFVLPTIDNDTEVVVTLRGGHAGSLGITIIPFRDGAAVVGALPVINYIFDPSQQTFTASARTTMKSEYFVSILSIRNNYTLTINSIWSPFDSLRAYVYLGLSAIPAGLLIIYYDRIVEKRDRMYRNALND